MTVSVRAHAGRVAFEIRDDGVGFDVDDVARGDGLTNLHDRIAAVGGERARRVRPGRRDHRQRGRANQDLTRFITRRG